MYILPEISAHHLQLKCMGGHFFPCHPYIESTTVLSDNVHTFNYTNIVAFIIFTAYTLIMRLIH